MDTLICAFADAFLATRLSIFSWNILEERWSASCRAWRPRLDTTYDAADSEVWSVFRASGGPQEVLLGLTNKSFVYRQMSMS